MCTVDHVLVALRQQSATLRQAVRQSKKTLDSVSVVKLNSQLTSRHAALRTVDQMLVALRQQRATFCQASVQPSLFLAVPHQASFPPNSCMRYERPHSSAILH
jgi:hypothetical protein